MMSRQGPLGFPMSDAAIQRLELDLRHTADQTLKRTALTTPPSGPWEGERGEVSWISTERVDHEGDLVIAAGMDDSVFALNPIVTFNHDYQSPPVGISLWRRRHQTGNIAGILARTHYPSRPLDWPGQADWVPDRVLDLVRSGLAVGKSIGFIAKEVRAPTSREKDLHPGLNRVIERWLLLEYAVCWLPANPGALLQTPAGEAPDPERLLGKVHRWVGDLVSARTR